MGHLKGRWDAAYWSVRNGATGQPSTQIQWKSGALCWDSGQRESSPSRLAFLEKLWQPEAMAGRPWRPSDYDSVLPIREVWVQCLPGELGVWELGCHVSPGFGFNQRNMMHESALKLRK